LLLTPMRVNPIGCGQVSIALHRFLRDYSPF
jgi:hypothetical protein